MLQITLTIKNGLQDGSRKLIPGSRRRVSCLSSHSHCSPWAEHVTEQREMFLWVNRSDSPGLMTADRLAAHPSASSPSSSPLLDFQTNAAFPAKGGSEVSPADLCSYLCAHDQ